MGEKIIAIAQQKGGVAKTTTAVNLGAALSRNGYQVLLIDLDPQGALSAILYSEPLKFTIYDALHDECSIHSIILSTDINCDLAPANINLAAIELELVNEPGREKILRESLSDILPKYDYILLDCPPSLGLLTLNALAAATSVLIPVQSQFLALRGLDLLMATIGKVKNRINPDLEILGILLTFFQSNTNHSREVLQELENAYPELLFSARIPTTIKLPDSAIAGQDIFRISPKSAAALAYNQLAKEIQAR